MVEDNKEVYRAVNLLLAEKRTSLAVLRTGIAIFTLPISVFTILIATSRYYDISSSLHFILPLFAICLALVALGVYLIYRSFRKLRGIDRKIQLIKDKQTGIRDIIDNC